MHACLVFVCIIYASSNSENDINLIHQYVKLALSSSSWELSKEMRDFLTQLDSSIKDNLTIHQTRDCQIIETKNHYVVLTFRTKKNDCFYNLIFSTKFKQDYGSYPESNDIITISYCTDSFTEVSNHTIGIQSEDGGPTRIYRKLLARKDFSSTNELISCLPASYLISDQKELDLLKL